MLMLLLTSSLTFPPKIFVVGFKGFGILYVQEVRPKNRFFVVKFVQKNWGDSRISGVGLVVFSLGWNDVIHG